jgi:hypothetical protein
MDRCADPVARHKRRSLSLAGDYGANAGTAVGYLHNKKRPVDYPSAQARDGAVRWDGLHRSVVM